jgi:hypothetical protein
MRKVRCASRVEQKHAKPADICGDPEGAPAGSLASSPRPNVVRDESYSSFDTLIVLQKLLDLDKVYEFLM